ncbi:MAG: DUF6544 family protein [Gemmatimonadaceae bacterium]
MSVALLVLLSVAIAGTITFTVFALAWRSELRQLVTQMATDIAQRPRAMGRFFTEQVTQLPDPVQRYFAFALSRGQPLVLAAHVTSHGEFRLRAEGGWHPFTATQHYSASPPAFVWDAEIEMAPLTRVHVRDRYFHGEGAIVARIDSVIPVVDKRDTPELASGELLRYLAEAVVMPTALLPSSGVRWSAVDGNTARATLSDRGTTVSAIFHFGTRGEIVRVSTHRQRDVGSRSELTPWVGQFRDYRSVQGMMVPMVGEVAWLVNGGVMSYFRGETTNITFELAA